MDGTLTLLFNRILSEMEIESTPIDTKNFHTLLQLVCPVIYNFSPFCFCFALCITHLKPSLGSQTKHNAPFEIWKVLGKEKKIKIKMILIFGFVIENIKEN